jgi:cytochrome bd ubiquinol oxidase subunit II
MDLNLLWFCLLAVLFTGYAILDGFDLGVGILSLFTRENLSKRIYINAIGPVWDGNEVWLLTGGGALFAAFPVVYATIFSGFYSALMLLLAALIARAVAMEFRGKVDSAPWRRVWDWAFGIGSLIPPILLGVAYGNILRGVPLERGGIFAGTFSGLLNPYAILVGALTTVLFTMHGAVYMTLKTEGSFRHIMGRRASRLWAAAVVCAAASTAATSIAAPFLLEGLLRNPLTWVLALLLCASTIAVPVLLKSARYFRAFLASCGMIGSLFGLSALSLFPRIVPSSVDLQYSLTVYNASSSPLTLGVMLILALIGMPLVIGYTVFIYRAFRGKVEITPDSY